MKKKILILSFSPIARDPRVMRQVDALESQYDLTVCGWGDAPKNSNIKFIQADKTRPSKLEVLVCLGFLLFSLDKLFYWSFMRHRRTLNSLKEGVYDLVLANDLDAIPIAVKVARQNNARLFFDLHEYFLGESEGVIYKLFFKKYNFRQCGIFLRQANLCVTVSDEIANKYQDQFGIRCGVIHNYPKYEDLSPSPMDEKCIRLIHHGVADPARNIVGLIQLVKFLDNRFCLDLVLVGDRNSRYFREILRVAKEIPNRVRILDPFPMREISKRANEYDLGVYMLRGDAPNNNLALPNKLFEWVQARLGVVTWPLSGMKSMIESHGIGVTSNECTVQSMANTLNALTVEEIRNYKENSNMAAHKLNASISVEKTQEMVGSLLSDDLT